MNLRNTAHHLSPILSVLLLAACGDNPETTGPGGGSTTTSVSTSTSSGTGGAADILAELQAVPGLTVEEKPGDDPQYRYFVMSFDQPADHADPKGAHFSQRLTLLFHKKGVPMVLASTGYNISPNNPYAVEPTRMLGANQLLLEHRFFADSRPAPADWSKLTIQEAAADYHAIVAALKPLFPGPWVNTGASKGGMTSVYHRRFYPDDVVGTIAYVAPQSYGIADQRYVDFLKNVGDPACRAALSAVQHEILARRPAMISRLHDAAAAFGLTFTFLGEDATLDYAVNELPFTFWQYYGVSFCSDVPAITETDDNLYTFLDNFNSPLFWNDESMALYEPYFWQAGVELGYPGTDDSGFASLLTVAPQSDVPATFVLPGPNKTPVFHPEAMMDIAAWLKAEGKNMLFVYGQNDPYSAAAFDATGVPGSGRFFVADGTHGASIADLSQADHDAAFALIEGWTGVKPMRALPHPRERAARIERRPR